jgi:hypothetical protein
MRSTAEMFNSDTPPDQPVSIEFGSNRTVSQVVADLDEHARVFRDMGNLYGDYPAQGLILTLLSMHGQP